MAKFLTFIFVVFALAGLYAGSAEAGHKDYYDPYYYGGSGAGVYSRNTAYVNGYSMDSYSRGYGRYYDRYNYYKPRVKGYNFDYDYSYQYDRGYNNYNYYDDYYYYQDYRREDNYRTIRRYR